MKDLMITMKVKYEKNKLSIVIYLDSGTKGYLSDETSGTVEIFIESKKLLQNNIKADEDDNVDENED
ncbi:unnamed protein product [Rotaria sordida]|nr:unnamed protein product [Rotaria sordida]